MASDSDVMTTREAAAFLGTHVETVRRFARRGDIPSFKVGKDWRYRKEALRQWAESQQIARKQESDAIAHNVVEARSPIPNHRKHLAKVLAVPAADAPSAPRRMAASENLLEGHHGMILSAVAPLPPNVNPLGRHGLLVLEMGLDSTTHRIIKVGCDELPKLGQEMLSNILENRTLPGALQEAKERFTHGYHSELRDAVITALEEMNRKYTELMARSDHRLPSTSCSVLIIDDEAKVRAALTRMVERFVGCRARKASDGAAGLELVAQETPDIILLDLVMPRMNGPQFLAKLRETHPQLPVVIVTGHPDGTLMQEAARFAPVMLLSKPVDAELLERTVRTVVGEKATQAT